MGLGELLHPQQDIDVLNARVAVLRVELHAAFQQKFGLVVNLVAGCGLGEQPHALNVALVGSQEVLAQPFRICEPVFRQVADYREQFGGQCVEKRDLFAHRRQARCVAAILVELGQALPTVNQGRVRGNRSFESSAGARKVLHGDAVVAGLLVRAAEIGLQFQYPRQGRQRRLPLVPMALRHRQGILRLDVVWLVAQ